MPEFISFTKKNIEKLVCEGKQRQVYFSDPLTRGLYVQVAAGGTKSFVYRKTVGGSKRQKFLGYFPDMSVEQARVAASKKNVEFATNKNPFDDSEVTRDNITLRKLFNVYIERHVQKKQKKTKDEMLKNFERWLLPLAERKISAITHEDAEILHQDIANYRGRYAANRAVQLARAIFNKGKHFKVFSGENPFANIALFAEKPRNRFLSQKEVVKLMNVLRDSALPAGPYIDIRDFVMLDLMTGARKSNLLAMRFDQVQGINSTKGTWVIPDTKSGTPHAISLGSNELKILKRRSQSVSGPWVFPSKTSKAGHIVDIKRAWTTIRKKTGLVDVTIHDLRRSLAAAMASQNINVALIQSALHHKDLKTTLSVYAKTSNQAVFDAKQKTHKVWFDEIKKKA